MLFVALAAFPFYANATDIEKGDVNDNGEVSVEDVALLRDIVLGKQNTSLSSSVTDINGDGVLSITDVTRLIKYLKEREEGGLNVGIDGWDESDEDYGGTVKAPRILRSVARIDEKTFEMDLSLSSDVEINGFQLTLNLPEGLELVEYSSGIYGFLESRNAESHILYNGEQPADGKLMFLAYSDDNDLFTGCSGDIMKFKIKAMNDSVPANCDVTVSSIEMSDKDCNAIRPSDFVVTGLENVNIGESETVVDVYSLNGAKVKAKEPIKDSTKGLPSGIYIINGKKVFVK